MIDYTKPNGEYYKVVMQYSCHPDNIQWTLVKYTFYRFVANYIEFEYDNGDSVICFHLEHDKEFLEELKETSQEAIQVFVNKLQESVNEIKRSL